MATDCEDHSSRPSPKTHLVTGDLLQRPGSPVACTAVLTLHDPDDLWGSLLIGRRVLTR